MTHYPMDFLIKIGDEVYLLESQSYDDGSMAIRIAEYAFIVGRQSAVGAAFFPDGGAQKGRRQ